MTKYQGNILDYPIQNSLTRAMREEAAKQRDKEFMSMWAGQGHFLCRVIPAGELIKNLVAEAYAYCQR